MMVVRVDALTDAQRAAMPDWAARWIDIGLRTGPADRPRFEAAVADCYRYAGLAAPRRVVWCPSPLVAVIAGPIAATILDGDAVHGTVRDVVRGAVGGAVDVAVGDAVGDVVGAAVHGAVGVAVHDVVGVAVRDVVGDVVGDVVHGVVGAVVHGAVRAAVRDAVGDVVGAAWRRYIGGQFWAGGFWWGAVYTSFFREVCDLELDGDMWDRARAYEATVASACWWWPHSEFVMVSERPLHIRLELVGPDGWGSHRLHCDDGPAVVWPDGFGVWAWHGTRVPRDLIETGWSVERILAEPNAEIRRCAIERIGWDRFIADAHLGLVDECADPGNPGQTLALYDVPAQIFDEPVRVVLCTNGTPDRDGQRRRFGLTVPADIQTALAAAAWTYDIRPDEYALIERRT